MRKIFKLFFSGHILGGYVVIVMRFLLVYFGVNQVNNYIVTNFWHWIKKIDEIVTKIDEIEEKPSGPEFE